MSPMVLKICVNETCRMQLQCNRKRPVPNPSLAACRSKGQYLRDKCWQKRKSCFIQEASNLGRWWTNVLRPSPTCQLGDKCFKGSLREGAAGYMSSSCAILGLVGIKTKFQASPNFWGLCACGQQFSSSGGLLPVKTTQECVSDLYLYLSGNWEFSDSAMWLVYSLNCYQFPGPTAILCLYTFAFPNH